VHLRERGGRDVAAALAGQPAGACEVEAGQRPGRQAGLQQRAGLAEPGGGQHEHRVGEQPAAGERQRLGRRPIEQVGVVDEQPEGASSLHRTSRLSTAAPTASRSATGPELTANRRPFVYVPLRNHFEQNFHVRHRLERHRAGLRLDYAEAADPDRLAAAIVGQLDREVDYLPVRPDGAARAAGLLADLL